MITSVHMLNKEKIHSWICQSIKVTGQDTPKNQGEVIESGTENVNSW